MILAILLISLLAVSAVNATDNVTVDVENQDDNVISELDNSNSDDNVLNANPKTFTDLNNAINGNTKSDIYLNSNYTYNSDSDSSFKDGIRINRTVTVYGNGYAIDGNNFARIFNVSNDNVVFKDIVFVNGKTLGNGAAIQGSCTSINCTFQYNYANRYGGAMSGGSAVNCTFIGNSAGDGGAMRYGSAVDSTFVSNSAKDYGGAMQRGSASNCTFIKNFAGEGGGGAISGSYAVNCTFVSNAARDYGGAMYMGSAVNCIFQYNHANRYGGAMYYGSVVNCTFNDNYANYGGAMSGGSAVNCTFIDNYGILYGGAMYYGSAMNCIFVNNDVYDVETVNCTFIDYVETVITTTDITTVYGISKNLSVTLKDVFGFLIVGEQISIVLNNVEYNVETNFKGEVSLAIPTSLAPKTYVATITYAGNDEYASSSTTADVVVNKADTSISAFYNNTANEILVTLTNVNTGKAISSANVKFNLNGKTTTVKTNSKGQAKISTTDLPMGNTVKISYAGNSKYKSTSTSIVITVKSDMIISAVYNPDNNELVATLTNGDTGKAVSSASVQVDINGATTTVKTNTKGQAKLSTADLPLGTYNAIISYAGNSKYSPASTSISVDVKTKVIVTDVYAYSDRIVDKLTNGATGKAIANANMIVEINGVKYNAKSDNKGQLTFDTTGLNLPSSYDLTISYRGNDRYTASSATVAVDLNKANMMITTNYHADKQKMVATLKNSKTGKAVSNANMIIDLNGVKTTYKSNDQGKITLPTTDFAPGTYVGTVTYPGNARYNSISAVFKIDI